MSTAIETQTTVIESMVDVDCDETLDVADLPVEEFADRVSQAFRRRSA